VFIGIGEMKVVLAMLSEYSKRYIFCLLAVDLILIMMKEKNLNKPTAMS
jgi:hypothetical protein